MPTFQDPADIIEHAAASIKEPIFPPYKPKNNSKPKNLVSVQHEKEKVKDENGTCHKEFTNSIKPVSELPSVPQHLNFQTKTANYIYKVIPSEENLIKQYDHARTKYKKNQTDINKKEDLEKLPAMLEIKLILKNEELNRTLERYEMDQVNNRKETEWNLYADVKFKLTVITALRNEMKF